MPTPAEINWLAGLLEGEACFLFKCTPHIQLRMTDADVISKARRIMKTDSTIRLALDKRGPYKTQYGINICGSLAAQWMMTIYSLMGNRRKEKIREILQQWKLMIGVAESNRRRGKSAYA